jgi:hypothetical protein
VQDGLLPLKQTVRHLLEPPESFLSRRRLQGFRFGQLRHTGATMALEAGTNPVLVAFRLGHVSTRLFPDPGPDIALDLVDSRATPKGVTIQVYHPAGRPQYGTATVEMNT